MAYLEVNCSKFTYEQISGTTSYKLLIDLTKEDDVNLSEFTGTSDLYVYVQYTYNNLGDTYEVLFEDVVSFTNKTYSQTNPIVFIGLNPATNEYGYVQAQCSHIPIKAKVILSTPNVEIITPPKNTKTIVSLQTGHSKISYSFKALTDLNSARIFCKDYNAHGGIDTYYFEGLSEYNKINENTVITNTLDVKDMFTLLTPVNGKLYTIGIEVNVENRFYSYNWVEFILSDGQHMIVLA